MSDKNDRLSVGQLRDFANLWEEVWGNSPAVRDLRKEADKREKEEKQEKKSKTGIPGVEYDPTNPGWIVVDGKVCPVWRHEFDMDTKNAYWWVDAAGRRLAVRFARIHAGDETSEKTSHLRPSNLPLPPTRLPEIAKWVRQVREEEKAKQYRVEIGGHEWEMLGVDRCDYEVWLSVPGKEPLIYVASGANYIAGSGDKRADRFPIPRPAWLTPEAIEKVRVWLDSHGLLEGK